MLIFYLDKWIFSKYVLHYATKQPYGVMVAQMILVHLVGVRISVGLPFAFKKSLVIKQKPDLENKFSALAFFVYHVAVCWLRQPTEIF